MMKKIVYYMLILSALAAGCRSEDDDVLLGRPEDRVKELLAGYRAQLLNSPYGWKGFVFPGLGGGYSFLFEFTQEGRVTMLADINSDCATKPYQSSFRLEAVQRPSLFFDTYSYLHILSDPNPDTLGGLEGQGLLSDFEFAFESTRGDTLYLKGNQNGTPLILIKATQAESEEFHAGALEQVVRALDDYNKVNRFVYIQSNDGRRINTSFDLDAKKFSLSFKEGDSLNITSVPFAYTTAGIYLQHPVEYKRIRFQEVYFDLVNNVPYVVVDGTRTDLRTSEDPVLALHLLLGVEFSVISVPSQPMEGWSQTFQTMTGNVINGLSGGSLGLHSMEFDFNTGNHTVNFNVYIQSLIDGRLYLAQYPYAYSKSADGVFTFSSLHEPNGNAEYIQPVMEALLFYFDTYRFRMEYLKTSNGAFVAQMKCVESPGFYFSGDFGSALN